MNIFFLLLSLFFVLYQISNCANVLVDGVTKWTDPIANIGDTIRFKHKNNYKLYIFRNQNAFKTCNFTQATHLSNPNSTAYTWHPSRAGIFYFSFYNRTNKPCIGGQNLAVKVNPTEAHVSSPAPSPSGAISGPPEYPWPNRPREQNGGPGKISPAPTMAVMIPGKGGISIPFVNSNPAVPLPTGEVDSPTIGLLPEPVTNYASKNLKAVGLVEGLTYLSIFSSYIMVMI